MLSAADDMSNSPGAKRMSSFGAIEAPSMNRANRVVNARPIHTVTGVASAAAESMTSLGWSLDHLPMIALFELTFVLLYLYPRTSMLGAVLMTALLGGAMATHIRVGSPLFSHILFSIYLALFMWGGLWLRSPALRAVFPFRSSQD